MAIASRATQRRLNARAISLPIRRQKGQLRMKAGFVAKRW
jgi:hypothetical protein